MSQVWYNLSNVTNATNIYEMVEAVNVLSNGFFVLSILVSIFFIMLIVLKHHDTKVTMIYVSFLLTLVSVLFVWAGLTKISYVAIPLGMLFMSTMVYFIGRGD